MNLLIYGKCVVLEIEIEYVAAVVGHEYEEHIGPGQHTTTVISFTKEVNCGNTWAVGEGIRTAPLG